MVYSLHGFGGMVGQGVRYQAYSSALRRAVGQETTVLDLGAGPGFWAITAARAGARQVYAVDPDESIRWGEEAARRLHLEGSIRFYRAVSTAVELPERVDCIVSDLRGCVPLFTNHVPSIIDARNRFLKPGGRLIGTKDTLFATVVEAPRFYLNLTEPWSKQEWHAAFEPALEVILNQYYKERFEPGDMLADSICWAVLDYTTIENADVSTQIDFTVKRAGMGHGVGVWFDAELIEGVGFSNAPGEPELIYGRTVFPWLKPVALNAGDRVVVDLSARLVNGDYVWIWNTEIPGKARFEQNTLHTLVASKEDIRKRASDTTPTLREDSAIDALVLRTLDGKTSIMDAAKLVAAAYPAKFTTISDAVTRVGDLVVKYGK